MGVVPPATLRKHARDEAEILRDEEVDEIAKENLRNNTRGSLTEEKDATATG